LSPPALRGGCLRVPVRTGAVRCAAILMPAFFQRWAWLAPGADQDVRPPLRRIDYRPVAWTNPRNRVQCGNAVSDRTRNDQVFGLAPISRACFLIVPEKEVRKIPGGRRSYVNGHPARDGRCTLVWPCTPD